MSFALEHGHGDSPAAAGLRPPRIVNLPASVLFAVAPLTMLPLLPRIRAAEIRRLLEHKAFDIAIMRSRLGVEPIALPAGLAMTLGSRPHADHQ